MGYCDWSNLEELRHEALDNVAVINESFPALLDRLTEAAVEVLGEDVRNGSCVFSSEGIHSAWDTALGLFFEEGPDGFSHPTEQIKCMAELLAILREFSQLMGRVGEPKSDDTGVWFAVFDTTGDIWVTLDWEQSDDESFIICIEDILGSLLCMYDYGVLKFLTGTGEDWDSEFLDLYRQEYEECLR